MEKPHITRIKKCFLELRFLNSEGYYRQWPLTKEMYQTRIFTVSAYITAQI
jgi:hypothetical protein